MKKLVLVLIAGLALSAAVAGCGGESNATTNPTVDTAVHGDGPQLAITADPDGALAYTESELNSPPGNVVVNFDNPSGLPHDVCFRDAGGVDVACSDIIAKSSNTFNVDLEPGEYTFYCSLPGHRQAGMEGILTVAKAD